MAMIMIMAVSQNGVIGKDNGLPWKKLPNDLKHFSKITTGKVVVMGRKTYESLPEPYRPLPNRENWVISNDPDFKVPEGVRLIRQLSEVVMEKMNRDIYVIGGDQIYKQMLMFADQIEMTLIRADFEGDATFTAFLRPNWDIGWEIVNRRVFVADEKHAVPYEFITYKRR